MSFESAELNLKRELLINHKSKRAVTKLAYTFINFSNIHCGAKSRQHTTIFSPNFIVNFMIIFVAHLLYGSNLKIYEFSWQNKKDKI